MTHITDFSHNVPNLRRHDLLQAIVTCGLSLLCSYSVAAEPLPVITVQKLQIAQVHVLNSRFGRTWTQPDGSKLTYRAIPNRPALIMLDVDLNGATNPQLQVGVGTQTLGLLPLSKDFSIFKQEHPSVSFPVSANTWYAMMPAAWMQKGVSVRIRANQNNQTNLSAKQLIQVAAPINFELYTLPYYLFGATTAHVSFNTAKTAPISAQQQLYAKWPISSLSVQNHPAQKISWPYLIVDPRENRPAYRINSPSDEKADYEIMGTVLHTLGAIRTANGDDRTNNQYYAPIIQVDSAKQLVDVGGGLGGGHIGTGDHLYAGVFIHEQGHALGLPHAGEAYRAKEGYPYFGGSLKGSLWGFDQNNLMFLSTLVPPTAENYPDCQQGRFDEGDPRQLDSRGRCIKQDSMQSGDGDQNPISRYAMHSDYNAAMIQHYFEGRTTLENGEKRYDGGRIFSDSSMPSGYARWDSMEQKWVNFDPTDDPDLAIYGAHQNFPIQKNTSVYSIVLTISKAGTAGATQIYPVIGPYQGNLIKTFDPTKTQDRLDMTPESARFPWYCRHSGCDYTVKVSYSTGATHYVALQGGFRPWYGEQSAFDSNVTNPNHADSFKTFAVNVPAIASISRIELLNTPTVWKGMPASPTVIASR